VENFNDFAANWFRKLYTKFYQNRPSFVEDVTNRYYANVPVPSGPLSVRNGLLIFGIVCLVTLLIFLHSLHLSTQLNVSISVISSTLHSFLRTGIVSLTFVLLMFLFYFFKFFSRTTVSAVLQLRRTCHMLFSLHVVLYVFLANKWWWW